ncbi:BON domain-containing protein [Rhodoferax sp.]|uniref:BON domain-containing protein n=1 Tax=Rhodoferax sp. TaxID=50421 RepID=UPI00374D9FBA
MKSSFKRIAASTLLAIAAGPLLMVSSLSAQAATASDASLETSVQEAISQSMGSYAKAVTVTADNGNITLHGWVNGARQESQARTVASHVPGTANVYSHIRVWSTDTIQ